MPLKVYIGEKFNYRHESEVFNTLIGKLDEKYKNCKDDIILIGNYYYNNQEIDATILMKNAITVIDFKKYGGKISFSENGKWFAEDTVVKGGNKVNPFIQLRTTKYALLNFFKNSHKEIVKSSKQINYGHINAIVTFHDNIEFDNNTLPKNLKNWFHITDINHITPLLDQIGSREISFTNEELRKIVNILDVSDYYNFEYEIDTPRYEKAKQKHELTAGQREALIVFNSFIKDDKLNCFILNGAAGTGKTFMIKEFVNIMLENQISDFRVLAPTGKASSNIKEKIIHDVRTIHSLIYKRNPSGEKIISITENIPRDVENPEINDYKVKDEKERTKPVNSENDIYEICFDIKENKESENTVYIIDECSLLTDNYNKTDIFNFGTNYLLSDLLCYANPSGTKRKIVLIGDDKQIQYGKSDVSSLNKLYLSENHKLSYCEYSLKEIVRVKKDSSILENAIKIRNSIANQTYNHFNLKHDNNTVVKVTDENIIDTYKPLDPTKTIIIKYTRSNCKQANMWVKEKIYGRSNKIEIGDLVFFYRNYFLLKTSENTGFDDYDYIPNGSMGIVKWVNPTLEVFNQKYGRKGNKCIKLEFRDIKLQILGGRDYSLKIFENFFFSDQNEITRDELIGIMVKFNQDYFKTYNEYPTPKKIGIDKYYLAIQSNSYFTAARIKHAYSITGHKAQGSEWANVFVDFSSFTGFKDEFYRWAYTAVTRATEKLFTINEPSFTPYSGIVFSHNQYSLDFKILNKLYLKSDHSLSEQLKKAAISINYPLDNEKLVSLFIFLKDIFHKERIQIHKIEYKPTNFNIRLFLMRNSSEACLQFIFDAEYDFNKPTIIPKYTNDKSFAEHIKNLICIRPENLEMNSMILNENRPFVKNFLNHLNAICRNNNIDIIAVEDLNYKKRIVFQENNDLAVVDFSYDDDGFFKYIPTFKTSSLETGNKLSSLIIELIKSNE